MRIKKTRKSVYVRYARRLCQWHPLRWITGEFSIALPSTKSAVASLDSAVIFKTAPMLTFQSTLQVPSESKARLNAETLFWGIKLQFEFVFDFACCASIIEYVLLQISLSFTQRRIFPRQPQRRRFAASMVVAPKAPALSRRQKELNGDIAAAIHQHTRDCVLWNGLRGVYAQCGMMMRGIRDATLCCK